LNLKTTPDALKQLENPDTIKLFDKYAVLSPRELHARYEVSLETYVKQVQVEAKLTIEIAQTAILPAALKYLTELGGTAGALKTLGVSADLKVPGKVAKLTTELESSIESLESALSHHDAKDLSSECEYLCSKVLPAMLKVRGAADALEGLVSDELWPLPTYQEMLFVR
jgi:glutamine synthetase